MVRIHATHPLRTAVWAGAGLAPDSCSGGGIARPIWSGHLCCGSYALSAERFDPLIFGEGDGRSSGGKLTDEGLTGWAVHNIPDAITSGASTLASGVQSGDPGQTLAGGAETALNVAGGPILGAAGKLAGLGAAKFGGPLLAKAMAMVPSKAKAGAAKVIQGLTDVRGPSEDVGSVIDSNFLHGRSVGDEVVPLSRLDFGVSEGDDPGRVTALAKQIAGPEGYWSRPIVDQAGNVLEGQHRLLAAQQLGAKSVPVHRVRDLYSWIDRGQLTDAVKASGAKGEAAQQIADHIATMVDEAGSAARVPEMFDLAGPNQKHFEAGLASLPEQPWAMSSDRPAVLQAYDRLVPIGSSEQMNVEHPNVFGPHSNIKPRVPEAQVRATYQALAGMDAPREVFDPAKLEGARIIPFYGDKSIAGQRLTSLNDQPLDVMLHGGPRYGEANAAQGSKAVWASEQSQISALQNKARQALESGDPVYGVHIAMGPQAADQSTMMADILTQQVRQADIAKEHLADFNERARQLLPDFPGIEHPDAMSYLVDQPQGARAKLVEMMDKSPRLAQGFPDVGAARIALTEPGLRDVPRGAAGFSVSRLGPESVAAHEPTLVHPTYGTQMAGTPVGGLEQLLPYDKLFPGFFGGRRAAGLSPAGDFRALEWSKPTDKITPQAFDEIMSYLERTKQGR